ncbi:hypothetical protein INT48_000836 [Thamnidium elegans]|uniref:Uncharacterized protein n=1 Tax=Thamnidium elegans TaxID=101142 RepID=A0A8H7SY76_9FUNG|nr:hypothetical protein INT48_000836 [Thamnidium elegans]
MSSTVSKPVYKHCRNCGSSSLLSYSEEEDTEDLSFIADRDRQKTYWYLTIISKLHKREVEIDLKKLDREQLDRIVAYVNACLLEKQGGPKVKGSDYTVQSVVQTIKETKQPINRRRRGNNNRPKSMVQEGHVVNRSATSRLSYLQGQISMAALTGIIKKKINMPTDLNAFKDSVITTKSKRRTAVHKRRLSEDMFQPSSKNDSSAIIVFGQEQMNLAVTQNETIVHQKQETVKV